MYAWEFNRGTPYILRNPNRTSFKYSEKRDAVLAFSEDLKLPREAGSRGFV
jgi:hypothetical protein